MSFKEQLIILQILIMLIGVSYLKSHRNKGQCFDKMDHGRIKKSALLLYESVISEEHNKDIGCWFPKMLNGDE